MSETFPSEFNVPNDTKPFAVLSLTTEEDLSAGEVEGTFRVYDRLSWNIDRDTLVEWAMEQPPGTLFKAVIVSSQTHRIHLKEEES